MVQIKPDYRDSTAAWQRQVDEAATHEEAQTQLLYALNVQVMRHRVFAQWTVIAVGVLLAVGVVLSVILSTS